MILCLFFFFSSRRRHTRWNCDWSSDVCSSDLRAHRLHGRGCQPRHQGEGSHRDGGQRDPLADRQVRGRRRPAPRSIDEHQTADGPRLPPRDPSPPRTAGARPAHAHQRTYPQGSAQAGGQAERTSRKGITNGRAAETPTGRETRTGRESPTGRETPTGRRSAGRGRGAQEAEEGAQERARCDRARACLLQQYDHHHHRSAGQHAFLGDLREPRKPQPPEVAQESVLPCRSVMVMIVLLKEACTCAIASSTFLRAFFGFLGAAAAAGAAPACWGFSPCWAFSPCSGFSPCWGFCCSAIRYAFPGGAFSLTACLRGPLRVRALVRVRWPRTGSPRR